MALPAGSRIGPYEVTLVLGAGGMGEVYKARDTRLNRVVAIKALQTSVATDVERIARFEREAQLLASLQHPNIAGIHGIEQAGGATYLVLEFVDGTPLDAVLRDSGALPVADAVAIARQIADAIAAAHEKGIIHRDLKPGNVMLTADGQVKVLDFGLGKSLDDGRVAAGESAASNSPTITLGATQAGIILGTAGYMSPEQAKGRAADRRSDVWSFGCLLFEMLAGTRAFEGEDITDTIAAIVRGEPSMNALPASTPPALRQLIERTLIKERAQRLPDMSVVRYVLSEPNILGGAAPAAPQRSATGAPRAARLWMAATLLSTAAAIVMAIAYANRGANVPAANLEAAPARFTIVLPDDTEVSNTNLAPLALAPDGRTLAFVGLRAGRVQLFVNDFTTGATKALDGTDGARTPFFSPDGRWIGFFAMGRLKKITVGGTALQDVADAPDGRGATWADGDTIYYAPTNTSGLWKVSAASGVATEVTKPDPGASEISHRNPYALPGGKALLFMAWTGPGSDEHRVEYLTLSDNSRQVVVRNADGPLSIVHGRLIYAGRQDSLLSAPWNASRPGLQGVEPAAVPFYAALDNEGAAAYAASPNGTFVHLSGAPGRRLAKIVWIDKSGRTEPLPIPDRDYVSATLSPDGTRAAIHSRGATEEIWIYDFNSRSFTPLLTPGGSSQAPVWTTDSKYIVYRGTRQGFRNIFRKAADGSGGEERLTNQAGVIETPTGTTPDGRWMLIVATGLAMRAGSATGGTDVMKVALDGTHETLPVAATAVSETAGQMSPDGRWVSFDSTASGRLEVWVQPFDAATGAARGPMQQVSRDGGTASRWSHDSRELYFMTPEGVMAASVNGSAFSPPRQVARGRYRPSGNANSNYDVARDGRILHVLSIEPTLPHRRIEVVLNGLGK